MITNMTEWSAMITIDSQSSITIFIDNETGKLLAVRTILFRCRKLW